MEKYPLVSVIIPTYSRPDKICRAIDSVLSQTYPNIEIIIVDDNGEGTEYQIITEKQLKQYIDKKLITYIKHDVNKNGSVARNTGYRESKGEYINFLDDDDVFFPNKIEEQIKKIKGTDAKFGAVYCNSTIERKQFMTNRVIINTTNCVQEGNLIVPYLLNECSFNTSSILFKRNVLDDLDGFDESWNRHQDYELMVRFFQKYEILCCSLEPLMQYDVTGDRGNVPNCKKQYEIEKRFLSHFQTLIPNVSYPQIHEKFWLDCMGNCLMNRDYETFNMAKLQLEKFVHISYKYKLIKPFFIGIAKRWINK